ncbi:MAG: hypothetical protein J3K34DRAFT_392989 [Monoraphidium minutum]|nr:MAG: hypothetical protein J3K34DRAFT_392989 [Monoraphidium minutum]
MLQPLLDTTKRLEDTTKRLEDSNQRIEDSTKRIEDALSTLVAAPPAAPAPPPPSAGAPALGAGAGAGAEGGAGAQGSGGGATGGGGSPDRGAGGGQGGGGGPLPPAGSGAAAASQPPWDSLVRRVGSPDLSFSEHVALANEPTSQVPPDVVLAKLAKAREAWAVDFGAAPADCFNPAPGAGSPAPAPAAAASARATQWLFDGQPAWDSAALRGAQAGGGGGGGGGGSGGALSNRQAGKLGEMKVFLALRRILPGFSEDNWRSLGDGQGGQLWGVDFVWKDETGLIVGAGRAGATCLIEVKSTRSTRSKKFAKLAPISFEQWEDAREAHESFDERHCVYVLVRVMDVLSAAPDFEIIVDPYGLCKAGAITRKDSDLPGNWDLDISKLIK